MADREAKSTTRKIETNDQADYYSGITSITVNGKNAYELKGKFLDDLHKNAFSGTNGEVMDKLRVVVFPISLVGDAWRWFDGIKGSITSWVDLTDNFFRKYYLPSRTGKINTPIIKWDPTNPKFENWLASKFVNYKTMDIFTKGALWDYWKLGSDEIEPTNDETSDLEETDHDDEQEIGEIFRIETNMFNYETPFWREDGYCNGGNLLGAYIVGNTLHYQDLEWYEALKDSKLKEETLRNKAIMEGLIDDDVESNNKAQELPVCTIRRFEMIKYSFGQDKEYVAIKEDEYKDLMNTSKEAIHAYQEIFHMMDEEWMDLVKENRRMLVKYLQSGNLEVLES
ncbi:hypothetical protein Tco_1258710 [Tanacetum coccineum]